MSSKYFDFPEDTLYEVKKGDLEAAAACLTDSFSEDPYMAYIMGSKKDDRILAKHFNLFALQSGLKYGVVYATGKKMEGVIICFPPEHVYLSDWQFIRAGALGLKRDIDRDAFDMSDMLGRFSKQTQKKAVPTPHWYVYQIGVMKQYRGQGMASRLLNPILAQLDSRSIPSYLETHNENNVALYEHYGYRLVSTGSLPVIGKPYWGMLRSPVK